MNSASLSIVIGAALAFGLTGCGNDEAPTASANGAPPQSVTNVGPIPQMPKGDPSVPDAVHRVRGAGRRRKGRRRCRTAPRCSRRPPRRKR